VISQLVKINETLMTSTVAKINDMSTLATCI